MWGLCWGVGCAADTRQEAKDAVQPGNAAAPTENAGTPTPYRHPTLGNPSCLNTRRRTLATSRCAAVRRASNASTLHHSARAAQMTLLGVHLDVHAPYPLPIGRARWAWVETQTICRRYGGTSSKLPTGPRLSLLKRHWKSIDKRCCGIKNDGGPKRTREAVQPP